MFSMILRSTILILKLVGTKHEIAKKKFSVGFTENSQLTGTTRFDLFIGAGREDRADMFRAKEPSEALRPNNTRKLAVDVPTITIKVDRPDGLAQLCNNAHFWLADIDGKIRVVILIHTHADNRGLHLEYWKMYKDRIPAELQELYFSRLVNGSISVIPRYPQCRF